MSDNTLNPMESKPRFKIVFGKYVEGLFTLKPLNQKAEDIYWNHKKYYKMYGFIKNHSNG